MGSTNAQPDSTVPRRLTSAMTTSVTRQSDQRMPMQVRKCRDQRGDARGDPDRHGQDVVEHQGRRRPEARRGSQVILGDRVGTPAAGIGGDGLAIREVQDRQQADDQRP